MLDSVSTPETFRQTTTAPAPDIEGCIVRAHGGALDFVFTISGLNISRGELQSQVSIDWAPTDGLDRSGRGLPTFELSRQGVNWRSNSSLDNLARRLATAYAALGKDFPFKIMVESVNAAVASFMLRALDIEGPDWVDQPVARNRLHPMIPESGVTIWFGPGDSGKGQIACCAATALAYQMAIGPLRPEPQDLELPWFYIDYEDSKREWDARLTRIVAGLDPAKPPPPNLYRVPGRLPFAEMAESLMNQIGPNIGGLWIDSAMPATSGDVKEPEPVRQFFAAASRWKCPIVLIAHETKAENDFYPYGNVFWHNLARATVNFRSALKGPLDRHVLIRSRKRNNGRGFEDIAIELSFSDDEIPDQQATTRLRSLRLAELVPELQDKRGLAERVEALLMREPNLTPREIASSLDAKPDSVGAVLRRDQRFGTMELTRGGRGAQHHWHVLQGGRQE